MKKYTLKKYKYLSLKKRKIKRESSSAKALLNKLNQLAQDKQLYKNHLEKHETLNINGMRELITEHENLNKVPDEELVDYKLLQKIDRGLIVEEKEKCLYGLIIETATTIMQSDHVSFHIYIPEKRCLKLSDYRGLNDKFAKFWQCVYELDESTYAHVMTEKKQIFVLDIEDCDFLQDTEALNAFRLLGIRSVLSSPLFSKSGEFFGVLSTHWNKMHQPLDRDFSLLDVIIRQSADLMEQVYERSALQENKMWITGLKEAFHAAMSRKPLAVSLRSLIDTVILQTKGSAKAAFYLIPSESDNLQHSIALSNEYAEVLKIFPEEPHFIDWSLVMNKEEPIITPDVELDPAWEGLRPLARKHNCRACWFFPIATPEGRIFGTLAIYYTEPREPTSRELEMASVLTHATAIIISLEQELVARMQTESVMRTSEQKLIEQVRLRDEFIANAGHELNSPLTCMMLYTNIIEQSFQENNTPFQFEILNKLKKQLQQLQELILDMLDTTCLEEGKLQLKIVTFNLNQLIKEKVQDKQMENKNHQFEIKLSSSDEIEADRNRIGQVITNLISNAIKYSPHGGKIAITSEVKDSSVQVNIIDSGLGIPKNDLEKIFERFYRVTKDNLSGMGIGLSICKDIINSHQGTLNVTSQEGKGSTFSFIIPRHVK